jgi:hypothetical protein
MRRFIRFALVGTAMVLMALPEAGAQTPAKGAAAKAAPPAAAGTPAKKGDAAKEINFEGEVVEAQFLRPDQGVAEAVVRRKKSSLIQARQDFVDEILKSAEDL